MAKKRKRTGKREHDRRGRQDSAMPDRRVFEGAMRELVSRLGGEAGELTASDRAQEVIYEAFEASGARTVRLARQGPGNLGRLRRRLRVARRARFEPGRSPQALRAGRGRRGAGTGQAGVCGTRRPFLGRIGNPPVHAGTRGPGPFLCGRPAKSKRRPGTIASCSGSTPTTTRASATVWPPYFWTWTARRSSRGSWPTTTTRPRRCGHTPRPCWHSASGATAQRPASCSPRPGRSTSTCPPTCSGTSNCRTSSRPYISPGGDDEAVSYAVSNRRGWLNTPGAVSWLRKTLDVPLPEPPERRRPSWPQLRLPCRVCRGRMTTGRST